VPNGSEISDRFNELLRPVDHAATSTTKYRNFERFLADCIEFPADEIYTTHVAKPGNFDVRMTQSSRARGAKLRVALLPNEDDLPFVEGIAARIARDRSPGTAILLVCDTPQSGWRPRWGMEAAEGSAPAVRSGHLARLISWFPDFELRTYQVEEPPVAEIARQTQRRRRRAPSPIAAIPLILDDRIRRMLRSAVASSKAVMLVGPPGTGKSTLIEEMVRDATADPAAFGLSYGHDMSVITPDESWTSRELLGGVSVDPSGNLKFTPGHVLQAIAADQWLLLDEANRADLDKIFGGMLTWLAGQEVTVGRESPGSPSEIILTWAEGPESSVEQRSPADDSPGATIYRAGQEWRLLGTYNSLDAHRVFRLGLALGRRFAQVPVPPPTADLFGDILRERLVGELPQPVTDKVAAVLARVYEIHASSRAVALGPALFLSIPGYVEASMRAAETDPLDELIAEGYLSAFGTWLVRLEDETLDEIGQHLSQSDALGSQWDWVREQLRHLA
jgi:MoxR-like ATPase